MDARLADSWSLTVNEKKFIEVALDSNLRTDGRNPLEYRKITIKFGREDGSCEVQLGHTHVMGFVTGRPGEFAVELGRVVDRGLRESRAIDTESLCVLAGRLAWAIRIDLHILDNGGNLVDAANIAAFAALVTFRRPECTLGGENGQEVIVHPPEVTEPLPLIVHHLPIAVTFAFLSSEGKMVVDPTHSEKAVMGGRMTVTANANADICAIQKAAGEGVLQSVIMRCLQLASMNAESITNKIKSAVEAYNTERALRKIKRRSTSVAVNVSVAGVDVKEIQKQSIEQKGVSDLSRHHIERLKLVSDESSISQSNGIDDDMRSSKQGISGRVEASTTNFLGGPSSWDPCSKVVDSDLLKATLASHGKQLAELVSKVQGITFASLLLLLTGTLTPNSMQHGSEKKGAKSEQEKPPEDIKPSILTTGASGTVPPTCGEKTLKDAVKPKNRRRTSSCKNAK